MGNETKRSWEAEKLKAQRLTGSEVQRFRVMDLGFMSAEAS
jgi:hypothetical protein